MSQISRRSFLTFIGAAGSLTLGGVVLPLSACSSPPATTERGRTSSFGARQWYGVPYPLPLVDSPQSVESLASYAVRDTLVVPDEFEWHQVVSWGDILGPKGQPDKQIRFGYNCDYTALVPIDGRSDEFYLVVNHEYVSARPWTAAYKEMYGEVLPNLQCIPGPEGGDLLMLGEDVLLKSSINLSDRAQADSPIGRAATKIAQASMLEVGVSIVHVRQAHDGRIEVLKDSTRHKRIAFNTRTNIESGVVLEMTGPAQPLVGAPLGTSCNCSGATTPWGTVLTCEENFQDYVTEELTPSGAPLPGTEVEFSGDEGSSELGIPQSWGGIAQASTVPVDPRTCGWVCEVFPESGGLLKHTALGRFRHENVTLHVAAREPIVAYMGDDRRGGHIWKFVSRDVVLDPADPSNSFRLREGKLFVARLGADFRGEWLELSPDTPLAYPTPEHMSTKHMLLPARPQGGFVSVGAKGCLRKHITVSDWVKSIESFTGKKFSEIRAGDLVTVVTSSTVDGSPFGPAGISEQHFKEAVMLLDAHLFANAIGGTPAARPEDLELDPVDRSVFVAFTDATGRSEGSPDVRVFPDSDGKNSRQYGAIFRIFEDGNRSDARTFSWAKLVSSGEVADGGAGFACADNLLIDRERNLWAVCDITTGALNGQVTRKGKSAPGSRDFLGLFGNSSLFFLERIASGYAPPRCFAVGPVESELTGPTFTPDEAALILSVQHPGEYNGTRGVSGREETEERHYVIQDLSGKLFDQVRHVPIGSNFPGQGPGVHPKPTVVCITPRRSPSS